MSQTFSVTLPSGATRAPTFVSALDDQNCIGCSRNFKVCPKKCCSHAPAVRRTRPLPMDAIELFN